MSDGIYNPNLYAVTHDEAEGKKIRKTIWKVFWILVGVTTIEVALGIFYKDWGIDFSVVKTTFIILTLVKAYFIVAEYMHLKHENPYLKKLIIIPYMVLAVYLILLVLNEGGYSQRMTHWMF